MGMENNTGGIPTIVKLPWLLTMISVCIAILISIYFIGEKEVYLLEGKILFNQMEEKQLLRSQEWDMNEWLPKHNKFLENYYNILLEYNNLQLTSSVHSIELCLSELYQLHKNDANSSLISDKIDECNDYGVLIDEIYYEILSEKLGVDKT